jgi:hypothetical protein
MSNITDFPKPRDLIAKMKGPENTGCAVIIDGRVIPNMAMYDRGDEIEFVLDRRLSLSFPRDQAWNAAYFAAAAMAIGAGFAHFTGQHFTQREYTPKAFCLSEDDGSGDPMPPGWKPPT